MTYIYLVGAVLGYLVGSFPAGVVLSRRKYGIDVREMGSGNIGATNVTRVFGWYAGGLVFLLDFIKGALTLYVAKFLYPELPWLLVFVGGSVVLGHCYSLYLKFRGGKGVSTSLGCLLVASPWAFAVGASVYVLALIITKISAVGSLFGVLGSFIYVAVAQPAPPEAALILLVGSIIVVRHKSNIQRLWQGYQAKKRCRK